MQTKIKGDAETSVSKEQYNELQKEYDQFVYMVSHDINAPFRHVKGFTDILIGKLDDDTIVANQPVTDAIQNSVTKCQDMLNALLHFSRIKALESPAEPYDLNQAVNSVQKQLTDTINKSGAIITCNALPTVNGYWQHLNDLFYHLITNAIKFQPQAQVPNIDIQSIDIDDGYQIKIIDNGIGIDPQFHDEVFTMFRQLNHDNDFEGIGAGLAYCRKIMRLHNGSITLSVTEAGQTCFTLTFPK